MSHYIQDLLQRPVACFAIPHLDAAAGYVTSFAAGLLSARWDDRRRALAIARTAVGVVREDLRVASEVLPVFERSIEMLLGPVFGALPLVWLRKNKERIRQSWEEYRALDLGNTLEEGEFDSLLGSPRRPTKREAMNRVLDALDKALR